MTETISYDPDQDNCRGGCRRNDNRRVAFTWFQERHLACPGCFEETFGGPPGSDDVIVTVDGQVPATTGTSWSQSVRSLCIDQGWLRVILETSEDGLTWDQQIIACGEDATELVRHLQETLGGHTHETHIS